MRQMNKTKRMIAMAGLLEGLGPAGIPAFAQTSAPRPPATQGGVMDHGMPACQAE